MRLAVVLGLALLLGGCGTMLPEPGDGPGRVIDNPAAIPDAVPRDVPHSRYGNPDEYEVFGQRYRVMESADGFRERGIASWYGSKFHGRRTSSGEPYDMYAMTAAHKHLPLPTWVAVRHLGNNREIVVKVNDRGPFAANRIIDLSYAAAAKLGMLERGTAPVEIRVVTPDEPTRGDYWIQMAAFSDAGNARQLARQLQGAPLSASPVIREGGDGLHRVRLGPLPDSARVDQLRAELESARFSPGHVIIPADSSD